MIEFWDIYNTLIIYAFVLLSIFSILYPFEVNQVLRSKSNDNHHKLLV